MNFPDDSKLFRAIPLRHSVRKYLNTPIDGDVVSCLNAEIDEINTRCGFSFKLVINEPRAFKNIFAYGKFENVTNYIIISAPKGDVHTRLCGLEGERLVLGLQAMGLNTCWVGLSYSKKTSDFIVPDGHKIRCVISIGYGQTQGPNRSTKSIHQLSNASDKTPQWFCEAMKSVQQAPTAINQQKFYFSIGNDATVSARPLFSLVGYTQIDLGIAICHFNLAAPGHSISVENLTSSTDDI